MNSADRIFLTSLGLNESGEKEGGRAGTPDKWRILSRNGRVLLMLPDEPHIVAKGVCLYAPKRLAARMVVKALGVLPMAYKFLPLENLVTERGGPIDWVTRESPGDLSGILLGNPKQEERRALLLFASEEHPSSVVKIATTERANENLFEEVRVLELLEKESGDAVGIPSIINKWEEDGFSAFSLPYFGNGKSADFDFKDLVGILGSWQDGERDDTYRKSSSWIEISDYLTESEKEELDGILLRRTIRHGDFAPWNIVADDGGNPIVIDWETGRVNDVPGWDLVHYILMESELVARRRPEATIDFIMQKLVQESSIVEFLGMSGWLGNEKLLLKTYLLGMKTKLENFSELMARVEEIA